MQPTQQRSSSSKKPLIIFSVLYLLLIVGTIIFAVSSRSPNSKAPVSISPFAANSRDTERETDIKAIHSQVEAYWAQNGYYPSLANLNDASFISANLRGMDTEALRDPTGTEAKLVSKPIKNAYSYDVLPAGCDNVATTCITYTLTTTLEGEINGAGTYYKKSLNDTPILSPN